MTVQVVDRFLRSRPCLEEIEGFFLGCKLQGITLSAEEMAPIEDYRARLMKGREIPNPTRLQRSWKYQSKRKPTKQRIRHATTR